MRLQHSIALPNQNGDTPAATLGGGTSTPLSTHTAQAIQRNKKDRRMAVFS